MTRRDILESAHEPFGDAFYFGPEFLSDRFRDDAAAREASTYAQTTYKNTLDQITDAGKEVRGYSPLVHPLIRCLSTPPTLPIQ